MIRKISILLFISLTLIGLPVGVASAQGPQHLDLPPGIAAQAQPLLADMMERMEDMGMSDAQMMADMQAMVDQLPPGIFLQILQLMPQIEMANMMPLHQQLHGGGGLLNLPPGQILRTVQQLAS